jgi:hypothetical protein
LLLVPFYTFETSAGESKKEVIGGPFDLTKHLDEDGIKV